MRRPIGARPPPNGSKECPCVVREFLARKDKFPLGKSWFHTENCGFNENELRAQCAPNVRPVCARFKKMCAQRAPNVRPMCARSFGSIAEPPEARARSKKPRICSGNTRSKDGRVFACVL